MTMDAKSSKERRTSNGAAKCGSATENAADVALDASRWRKPTLTIGSYAGCMEALATTARRTSELFARLVTS
jgi:hypothetical protein